MKQSPAHAAVALAKRGLNYVIDEYLPRKVEHPEKFLP